MRRFYEPVIVPEDECEVLCTDDFACECAACLEWRAAPPALELERAWQVYYERFAAERGEE